MDPAFWRARWAEHKTGFHEGKPNGFLERHIERFDGRFRVLVPLCGKSEDLAFLAAHGHGVVGIELVEDALVQFFAEHAIEPEIERRGGHVVYTHGTLTLVAADWFDVTPQLVGPVDAIYDRAALIALPPELRPRYVAQLRMLASGAPGLVVALDYADGAWSGPPFNVGDAEVRDLYDAVLLDERPNRSGRIADEGVASTERCYAVQL